MSTHKQVGLAGYAWTFVALVGLATASLLLSFLHWKTGGVVVALTIAFVKAALVLFFFMGLAEQRFSNRFTMLVAVLFVSLLVGLTAADVASRHTFPMRPAPPATESFYRR
jgi:caa(3)-type oxidase subunit IV